MEVTLTDRAERATGVIINGGIVRFVGSNRDDAPDRYQSDITYPAAFLLELIDALILTPGAASAQIALYDNTQVTIRLPESQENVVELQIGDILYEGAGLCLPLFVVRAVLAGGEAASRSWCVGAAPER